MRVHADTWPCTRVCTSTEARPRPAVHTRVFAAPRPRSPAPSRPQEAQPRAGCPAVSAQGRGQSPLSGYRKPLPLPGPAAGTPPLPPGHRARPDATAPPPPPPLTFSTPRPKSCPAPWGKLGGEGGRGRGGRAIFGDGSEPEARGHVSRGPGGSPSGPERSQVAPDAPRCPQTPPGVPGAPPSSAVAVRAPGTRVCRAAWVGAPRRAGGPRCQPGPEHKAPSVLHAGHPPNPKPPPGPPARAHRDPPAHRCHPEVPPLPRCPQHEPPNPRVETPAPFRHPKSFRAPQLLGGTLLRTPTLNSFGDPSSAGGDPDSFQSPQIRA
ncbi:proline-rich protein 2-like [Melozone crissalis]|uniref:proline-rich protein 2-like n=1 Tax=Melozone crissalis TaxID=40204 RepID=UPI0023DAA01C|nr:proline-rich protein 2-like [Melozone crissalis]